MLFTFPSRYLFTIGLSGVFSLTRWSWQIHTEFLVFRATQDTARFTLLTCTRLSLSLVVLSKTFHFTPLLISQSYNPSIAETILVWANPRSIATTRGITFVFFSSGYLDVSVLRVCLLYRILIAEWVAPFGNSRIKGYLHLPKTYRSLSRPSSPLRAKASAMRPYLLSLNADHL